MSNTLGGLTWDEMDDQMRDMITKPAEYTRVRMDEVSMVAHVIDTNFDHGDCVEIVMVPGQTVGIGKNIRRYDSCSLYLERNLQSLAYDDGFATIRGQQGNFVALSSVGVDEAPGRVSIQPVSKIVIVEKNTRRILTYVPPAPMGDGYWHYTTEDVVRILLDEMDALREWPSILELPK